MNLFHRFENFSLADIEAFINDSKEEDLMLEFKTVNSANLSHRSDKKNLAIAISGFANSSGGLLVWGIEASKNSDGIDCAYGKKPIKPIQLFISRLNELTGESTVPRVGGILHKAVPLTDDEGFAVTLIPESDSGPHMAKLGEDRYYKRSGDSFYRMEHFDIADMFGRRKKPRLTLEARILGRGLGVNIVLGIRNDGRGSACAPYLAFNVPKPFKLSKWGVDGNMNEGLPRLVSRGQEFMYRYGGNRMSVIHPTTTHDVAVIFLGLNPTVTNLPKEDLVIEYEVSAEDVQLFRSNLTIRLDDLL